MKAKRKRARGTGHRKKKKGVGAPSPYTSWSGTGPAGGRGGGQSPPPPPRIVTSVHTVLDYVRGTWHRPKSCMEPFPLLDGSPAGQGELILLIVPPGTKATGSHKAEANEDSD